MYHNKYRQRNRKRNKKQRGFTLIEVLITVGLLGLLISSGFYFADFNSKRSEVDNLAMIKWTGSDMVQALLSAYIRKGHSFTGMTKQDITNTNSVRTSAPGNLNWSAAVSSNSNIITVTIAADSVTAATQIKDVVPVSGSRNIDSATVSGNNVNIVYRM